MFKPRAVAALLTVLFLTACEGLRDALTAHTETVARAGDQELTATELGNLIANSNAPPRRDVARALADIWVNYQLLGLASGRGDSLNSAALVDSAMWSQVASNKAQQYYQRVSAGWDRFDSSTAERDYAAGDLLAASHILLATQGAPDSVKRAKLNRIRTLRATATSANFAQLARDNSEDPGSAAQGGSLGVFPRGSMVPEFERGVTALRPGQISDVVESPFGYHLIRRPTFPEARADFLNAARMRAVQRAESTFTHRLDSASQVRLKGNAAAKARAVAVDPEAHRDDRDVLATSKAGAFTAASLVRWLETFPPQQQMAQRIQSAPDSGVESLLRNFVRNELVVRAADSAGIRVSAAELGQIRSGFAARLEEVWLRLGIHPRQLGDSARTTAERERVAASRVTSYIREMLAERAPYIPIVPQLQWMLRSRYDARVNPAGLDRALQMATRLRAKTDSARAANEPRSAVPVPPSAGGAEPVGPPPQAAPPGR